MKQNKQGRRRALAVLYGKNLEAFMAIALGHRTPMSGWLLETFPEIPRGCSFRGLYWSHEYDALVLALEHPSFDEVPEGHEAPLIRPQLVDPLNPQPTEATRLAGLLSAFVDSAQTYLHASVDGDEPLKELVSKAKAALGRNDPS